MIVRRFFQLLALVTVVGANFDDFGNADSSGQAATCEQGFVIEGSGCVGCPAGTKAKSDQTACETCPIDTYSLDEATVCIACDEAAFLGTVSEGSTKAEDCVTVCTVPTVQNTKAGTTAAGTLLATGEESTIECASGYQYGDQETQIIKCDTDLANSGYPAECRKITLKLPSVPSLQMGSEALLTCTVENDAANSDITWFKGDSQIDTDGIDNYGMTIDTTALTSVLTIKVVDDTHTASYSCKLNYPLPLLSEQSIAGDLTVLDIQILVSDVEVDPADAKTLIVAGESLSLMCQMKADSKFVDREIEWFYDTDKKPTGVLEGETSPYKHKTFTKTAELADTADYSCKGTYGNNGEALTPMEITKDVKVYVVGYSKQPENTFSEVGAALTLSCTVQGDAATTVTWTKTVNEVDSNPTPEAATFPTSLETASELRISSAQLSDSGSYKCSATFGAKTVESTVATVTVLDIGISEDPVKIGFLVGEDASLSCKVKNPTDNPATASWVQVTDSGDKVVEDQYIEWANESPVGTSTLRYDSATHDNAGVYKCKADYTVDGKTYSRESTPVNLFIRELQQKLDEITLVKLPAETTKVFTCTYKGDDGIESISWTLNGDVYSNVDGWSTVEGSYVPDDKTWESTLTVSSLSRTSGKLVKCSVDFKSDSYSNVLSSESTFVVRSISAAPEMATISDQASVEISCIYAGTNDPDTVQWRVGGSVKTSDDTGFTVTTEQFHQSTNNERKTTLTITEREYTTGSQNIDCEFIFSTNLPQETMKSSTTLYFRGIVTPLEANYYSIGTDSVSLICELGVGSDGNVDSYTASWYLNYNEADADSNVALKNEGDYALETDLTVANSKVETTLTISSANIAVALAGKYTCAFVDNLSNIYKSEGNLVVRLVTITPSDPEIYSYRNDGVLLSCTLESSDTTAGVTWSGPTGFDSSGLTSKDPNNADTYILTLPQDAAAAQYSCEFAFTDGPTFKPVGIFLDVNMNLIEMTNPTTMYSTYGVGVTVTFSCSAGSRFEMSDLNFYDGTQEVAATRRSYENGKTNAEYDYVVDTKDKDAEFKCYKSADETSDSTTLDVMTWTQELAESTEGYSGESKVLLCKAEWNTVDQNKPAFTWLKGASAAEETKSDSEDTSGKTWVQSELTITLAPDMDGSEYSCTATYTGLTAGQTLTSATDIKVASIEITPAKYAIVSAGESVMFTCVVIAKEGVNLKWRKHAADYTESNKNYVDLTTSAQQDDYDPDNNSRKSTLTLSSLAPADDSDSIECYEENTPALTATMELNVVEFADLVSKGVVVGEEVIFTCTVQPFPNAPLVIEWFQKASGSDTFTSKGAGANTENSKYEYTIAAAAQIDNGVYYCQATYTQPLNLGDAIFKPKEVNLYVRQINPTPTTPVFIHTGETISLDCTLSIIAESAGTSEIKWYKGGEEVVQQVGVVNVLNGVYDGTNELQKSTYTDMDVDKDDGGVYKCEFTFDFGETISFETTVHVHLLTPLDSDYINPSVLNCDFQGSNEPTISWWKVTQATMTKIDPTQSEFSAYTLDPGSWVANAVTAKLNIDLVKVTDATSVTCKLEFAGLDDPLETNTMIHKREISSINDKTYTMGEEVILECVFFFGLSGTGPASVEWKGIDASITDSEKKIDENTNIDGTRTTTLTFPSTDNAKFDGTYTCSFVYDDSEKYDGDIVLVTRLITIVPDTMAYIHTNDGFSVTCTFAGQETPSDATWTLGDKPLVTLTDDYTLEYTIGEKKAELTKTNPSSADDGVYTCKFTMEVAGDPPFASTTITVGLLTMTQPETYFGAVGGTLSLECTMKTDVPNAKMYWFKDGVFKENVASPSLIDGSLKSTYTITPLVAADHDGSWSCSSSDDADVATHKETSTTSVTLKTLDFVLQPPAKTFGADGMNVALSCKSSYGEPGVTVAVVWLVNDGGEPDVSGDKEITQFFSGASNDKDVFVSSLSIAFTDDMLEKSYSCKYTFSGDNVGTDNSITSSATTVTQMAISGLEDALYIEKEKKLSISCTAIGDSATAIEWTYNGLAYTAGVVAGATWDPDTHSITSTITIETVDTANDGNYVCEHSDDNSLQDTMTVDVYEVEVVSKEVKTDTTTVLTCMVKGVTKPFTFAWVDATGQSVTAQSENVVDEDKNQKSELTLSAPQADTTLTCTLTDPLGVKSDPATLKLNVFEITPTDAKGRVGEDAVVTCEISDITQAVTVVFNDGTDDLASEANVRLIETGAPLAADATTQTAKMTLYSVQDDATFTCKVTSGEYPLSGVQSEEVKVSVSGVTIDVKYAIKKVGESQNLVCTGDGDASMTIGWFAADAPETALTAVLGDFDNKAGTRTSTLSFASLKIEDSKEYTCTVTYGEGEANKVSGKARIEVVGVTISPDVGKKSGDTAVFSCDFNTFSEAAVLAKWFKKNPITGQADTEQTQSSDIDNSQTGKSIFTLTTVQFTQSGDQFYCKVEYQETASGATEATAFESEIKTLFVRELVTSTYPTQYIHVGDTVSLFCDLKVKTEDELESMKWFIGSDEVDDSNLLDNANFDTTNTLQKTTYTDPVPDKTEGGVYKCQYNFKVGDPISLETTVAVHFLAAWPALTLNENSLKCEFEGTNQPTIKWHSADGQELAVGGSSPYSVTPGGWTSNSMISTLNIDKSKYLELNSITCKITFENADVTDPLETSTAVHFREIEEKSTTTYTTGEDVVLSCVFDFTKGGTGPTTVKWSDVNDLTENDEYTVDLGTNGVDGKRTTTLTLKAIDDAKYAQMYTCNFEYSDTENYESEGMQVSVRVVNVEPTKYFHTNANFKVTCSFIGAEKPTGVNWSYKGPNDSGSSPITSGSDNFDLALVKDNTEAILTKGPHTTDDNGEYNCEWEFAVNPSLKPTGTQNVIVALLQMPQKDLSPINEPPGIKVDLTCTVVNDVTLDIFWYKGDQYLLNLVEEFDPSTKIVKTTLTIDSFANSDAGEYSCRLANDGSTSQVTEDSIILKLQGLDTTPEAAGSIYVEETKSTTIACKIDNQGTVTWTKGGSPFDDADIYSAGTYDPQDDSTTSTLTFTSVTVANEGVYVCTYKTLTATFTLDAFGFEVQNKEVKSGEATELICSVTGINKVFSFAWTDSDGGAVNSLTDSQPNADNIQNSKITVTPTQDTTYKCIATDPLGKGTIEDTITLNVFEITDPTEVMAQVGVATSLTCGVTGNTGTPNYVWYKIGSDTPVYTDPGNTATSTYTIADPQFSDDGAYKCTVAMKVGDFTNDAFESATTELIMKLYPKELTTSFGDETTVKAATDTLVCTYKGDNDVSSVVWTGKADAPVDTSKVETGDYNTNDQTKVSTYTFTGVEGKDGGDYTCTFNFNKDTITPLSKKTQVTIAVLGMFDAITINEESLDCTFFGTFEPASVKWYTAANQEVDTTAGSAYSIPAFTWDSDTNSITSTLNVDKSKYTDVVTFTCAVKFETGDTFPDSEVGLETVTSLHFREIETQSSTTYSTGQDVTLSCVFDFTKGGTGPASVEWTQIDGLTMATDYLVDLGENGADGKRTTTLSLKGIDDPKFAELYTCGFKYSETEKYVESIQVHVRVATVDQASQYVHTNANFKITCDFVGKETPSSVTWSYKATADAAATTLTDGSDDFGLELIKDSTQAILTKSNPISADDGEYTCEFDFAVMPSEKGTAKADIVAALLQMPQHTLSPITEAPAQKIILTCTVKSDTSLDIFWYKGATELTNTFEEVLRANVISSELTIASFTSADIGEYSCRLDNDGSILRVSEQRILLKIQGLEPTPLAAGAVYAEVGKSASIACKIDSEGIVTWTKDGDSFTDAAIYSAGTFDTDNDEQTSTLSFASVSKDNEGVYVCTFKSLSATFTLDAYGLSVTNKEVKSGVETVLTCKVTDVTSAFSFTWTDKDSKVVNALSEAVRDENDEQESELTVTPTEDTTYTCTATDATQGQSAIIATLDVFEITNPTDVYAEVGVATSLTCGVTGNTGTPNYVWYKIGSETPVYTDPGNAATSTYTIADPQLSDDGAYHCKVSMKVGDVTNDGFESGDGKLVVRQVSTSFGDETVVKTATETFVCTFKGDDDVSSVQWTGPKGVIDPATKIVTSNYEEELRTVVSTYTFDGTDGGQYTCTFNFNSGPAIDKSTNVVVFSMKQIETRYFSPEHIEVEFEGTFEPTITWYIAGVEYDAGTNTQLTSSVSSAWNNNAVTFKLAFKMSAFSSGIQPFTVSAKLEFGDESTEVLTTQDATVYKRELITGLASKVIITDESEKFQCRATGEDNTIFAIKWYLDGKLLDDSQDYMTITEEAQGKANRDSTLTVDNTRSDFNGLLKCSVSWPEPAPYTAESSAEVTARGAYMEEYSYSDSDGDGVMVCNAWNPETVSVTFTWKKSDGSALVAEADKITITPVTEGRLHTSTVKILDMTSEQGGDYQCEVKFDVEASPKIFTTKLQLLAARIEHSGPDHDDTAYIDIGAELLITCTYSGDEEPSMIEWLKGTALKGDLLTDQDVTYEITTSDYDLSSKSRKSILKLKNGDVKESGLYTCKWTVALGAPTATLNVRVMGLAVTGDVKGKTYGLDGSLVVACKYSGIEPGTISWHKDATTFEAGDKIAMSNGELSNNHATYTLTISDTIPGTTGGQYTCKMTYDDGFEKSTVVEAVVRTAAVVEGVDDTVVSHALVLDGPLSMRCIYKGVDLPNGISWFYGSEEIDFNNPSLSLSNSMKSRVSDPVHVYQSSVNLGDKTVADEGKYSCIFHLDDSQDTSAEAEIKVVSVTTPDVCVFVDYGAETKKTLTCSYSGSAAALSFKTKFPGGTEVDGELGEFSSNKQTGTFELIDITDAKAGTYECVFGLADDMKASTEIKVSARKAEVSTSVGTSSPRLLATSSVTITCTVASGAKTITWYKNNAEFTTYDVVEENNEKSEVSFEIEDSSGGSYTCKGVYYNDDCPTQHTFTSQEINLEVITDAATTQPQDITVTVGEKGSFQCVFPDPYGDSKTPSIEWRVGKRFLLGDDLYNDDGEVVMDGSIENIRNPGTYSTILTIEQVTIESAGKYTCSIKWGGLFIHSEPATLVVRAITSEPSTVNVPEGTDAKLSCVAISDVVATITFHKTSDDSSVTTVVSTDDSASTSTSTITSTGVLTLSGVTPSHAVDYYCKATWGDHDVKSSNVHLSVLSVVQSKMADSWGLDGNSAMQYCYYEDKIMASTTKAFEDEDGRNVLAVTSVAWEYDSAGSWLDISDNSLITAGTSFRDDGLNVAVVNIGPLASDKADHSVRCKVTYTADPSHHLQGGVITSNSVKVNVIHVTSFVLPSTIAVTGDTVTLSCSATGETQPTFKFTAEGSPFSAEYYTEVAAASSVVDGGDGNVWNSEYKFSVKSPNMIVNGENVVCEAEFTAGTVKSEEKELKTYYSCGSEESKAKITLLKDTLATISYGSVESDGSLTASTVCNDNTASEKYTKATDTVNSASVSKCSRDTGFWTPPFLSPCLQIVAFSQAKVEQTYDLTSWTDTDNKYELCSDEAAAELTEAKITEYITSTSNADCGARHVIPCLKAADGSCSVKAGADLAGCDWNKDDKILTVFVTIEFTPEVETIQEKKDAVTIPAGNKLRFFNCVSSTNKRSVLIEILDRGPVDTTLVITNTTVIDEDIPDFDIMDRSSDDTAKLRLLLTVGGVCVAALIIIAVTLIVRRRTVNKRKTLKVEVFPGRLVISDA